MYKHASRNLQRAHRVDKPLPTGGYVGAPVDHDFIASAENMSLEECQSERRQLMTELTKAQNELLVSKRAGDAQAVSGLGHRIQQFVSRLSLVKKRINALTQASSDQAFGQATFEIVDSATWDRIIARQRKLMAAGFTRDSGSRPEGENSRSEVEGEARQSGPEASPGTSPGDTP